MTQDIFIAAVLLHDYKLENSKTFLTTFHIMYFYPQCNHHKKSSSFIDKNQNMLLILSPLSIPQNIIELKFTYTHTKNVVNNNDIEFHEKYLKEIGKNGENCGATKTQNVIMLMERNIICFNMYYH